MKDTKENPKKENKDKVNFQSLGNVCLLIIAVLIIGNALLIYYMINSKEYQEANPEIMSNTTVNENEQTDTVANILNSVVSGNTTNSVTVNTVDTNANKIANENIIVLFNGLILNTEKMDCVELQYIDGSSAEKDKYEITYYNYENFVKKDSTLGKLSEPYFDNLLGITNVSKIAISENYEAIPRTPTVVNTIPAIVLDNNSKLAEFDTVKTVAVDLDGNGTEEYIIILANKTTGMSEIMLFDSTGKKVDNLVSMGKNQSTTITGEKYYFSLENLNILDVDGDGIMEILVEVPKYEGEPAVSILKYKNSELVGKTNIECSLLP